MKIDFTIGRYMVDLLPRISFWLLPYNYRAITIAWLNLALHFKFNFYKGDEDNDKD